MKTKEKDGQPKLKTLDELLKELGSIAKVQRFLGLTDYVLVRRWVKRIVYADQRHRDEIAGKFNIALPERPR